MTSSADGPDPLVVSAAWADDVAHELAAPVAFLDGLIAAIARGRAPDEEHLSIAAEEVGRLLSLVKSLRRVKPRPAASRPRLLSELLDAAADTCECRPVIDAPGGARIHVDDAYAAHGLAPLFRAFGRAAAPSEELRITARVDDTGSATIAVSVTATRVSDGDGKLLFVGDMWTAAAAGRASIDVVLAKRILRAHGHKITCEADGATHTLRVHVPPSTA